MSQARAESLPDSSGCPSRIVLTGFMGAGKTTVGQLLAAQLDWRFVDVDQVIEASTGSSIAQLFHQYGESWFRQLEHETILELASSPHSVLALGGGALEDPRTLSHLLEDGQIRLVHLEASLQTVFDRCRGTESIRPVLADRANLESRYRRRLPLYRQSHLTVPVDALLPQAVAQAILAGLFPNR